ncbi:hypothetical protein ACFQLX_21620 [Streptomyces polyrhachis]|uniref:Lipoprotein n=1 Tax=Streptomyces polyrhachis TaxID=1282885 RepID=A0ABW2GIX0_9ACTN
MKLQRPALSVALCAVAVLGPAACSGGGEDGPFSGLSGAEVLDKALKTTKSARSVTMDLDVTSDANRITGRVSLDRDARCNASLSLAGQGSVDIIKEGRTVYLRSDEAFVRAQSKGDPKEQVDAVVKVMKGKWIKSSVSDADIRDLAGLCDLDELFKNFDEDEGSVERGPVTEAGGAKALTLTGKGADGSDNTALVATEGRPYLLKLAQKGGDEPSTVVFGDYNEAVDVRVPDRKEILDLEG